MTVHAYTSFSYAYLNRARVLAASLREQHPDWVLWAVLTDREPEGFAFDLDAEDFDRMVTAEDLFGDDTARWLFGHDVVEACTAVKARALQHILAEPGASKIVYLDPDIAVFNPLDPLIEILDDHSIALTPHQITPDPGAEKRAVLDNEITSLSHGAYNLGFLAVRNDGEAHRFAAWWAERLQDWCHDRRDIGVFVDQKWCDLVPCFFDNVKIIRDPGYNVASWNLSQRTLAFDPEGTARVNGAKLRFYHFTKLGALGDLMTARYAGDNAEIYELWWWYRHRIDAATDPAIPQGWWYYGAFDNGRKIPKSVRELYREREDLRSTFVQPFKVDDGFFGWLADHDYL